MNRNYLVPHAGAIGCALATVILAGLVFTSVPALADVDVHINIGNAPPPPRFVFRARPHEVYLPHEGVYVVDDAGAGDNDCFRYEGYYWAFRGGYWYRSMSWRGRFYVVSPRYVPTVFYQMPRSRWKHRPNSPPGFTGRGEGGHPGHSRHASRERDKHHDHGNR
jgi:hypothetical protein